MSCRLVRLYFVARFKLDASYYQTVRLSAGVNIPLVEDKKRAVSSIKEIAWAGWVPGIVSAVFNRGNLKASNELKQMAIGSSLPAKAQVP